VKLASADVGFPQSWTAQRWLRLVETVAPGQAMAEGLEYARAGQTRRLSADPGKIKASVQGSIISSYDTVITLPTFTHEQSEKLIGAMVDQAVYAAKLLAGELPANIEDAFAALGLRLFPSVGGPEGGAGELIAMCNCRAARGDAAALPRTEMLGAAGGTGVRPGGARPPSAPSKGTAWCKHACCVAYLVAERFTSDPFLIFTLRGLPKEELLERLRQRRMVAGSGQGSALVYAPMIPGVSDLPAPALEEALENFWDPGPGARHVDLPIAAPEVSHPLLRRLGPSPFSGGRFPLVGLLATSYGMVSEAVLKQVEGEEVAAPEVGADEGEDEEGPH
jgi:uncharacterized Zn finger protein